MYGPLDYQSQSRPIWCPGCGDYHVLSALFHALSRLQVDPWKVAVVSGIGCSGRLPGSVNAYGFHTVHGRVLPVATGVKIANPALTVIAAGGDGDGLGIGGGHLPHVARRNPSLTYLLVDNGVYGQTKGQTSPTTPRGTVTVTAPFGSYEEPLNPALMALAYGATFVAQGFAAPSHLEQLIAIMVRGMQHKGFAFIHVISPCVTFNAQETYRYYQSLVKEMPPEHKPQDLKGAMNLALEGLYLGVFYEVSRPTLEESLQAARDKAQEQGPGDLETLLARF